MTNFERSFIASSEKTYSLVEKYVRESIGYHITQRTIDRSVYAEGGKDINPNYLIVGLVIGFVFIILIWPIGLLAFIIMGLAYAYGETNKLHFDVKPLDDGHCDLAVTANGNDATKTAEKIVQKLEDSINKPVMMKEQD